MLLSPYRHATAHKALSAAIQDLSWLDAHDLPTPPPIVAACRLGLSRGAAMTLDEQPDVEREATLSAIRGALASPSPYGLSLIERELAFAE